MSGPKLTADAGRASGGVGTKFKQPPTAPCRLCLEVRQIQDSHILPKWVYRRMVARRNADAPPPVAQPIRLDGRTAVATNTQPREHLLCSACEQRLGLWDDYASRITRQRDGRFPALDDALVGEVMEPGGLRLGVAPDIDGEQLTRFVCSVLWRASITSWRDFDQVSLGPFEERFRRFLIGEGSLPDEARLVLKLLSPADDLPVDQMAWGPIARVEFGMPAIGFVLFGIDAGIWFAPPSPSLLDEVCYARTGRLFVSDGSELLDALAELAVSTPVQSLARAMSEGQGG
jgi:hypothetical protein